MITVSNPNIVIKVIPVIYAFVKTTIRLAFQPKNIAIILRITYIIIIAS